MKIVSTIHSSRRLYSADSKWITDLGISSTYLLNITIFLIYFLVSKDCHLGANIWKSEPCICLQNFAGLHFSIWFRPTICSRAVLSPLPISIFSFRSVIIAVTFHNDKGWESCWDFWFKCYFMAVPPLFLFAEKTQDLRNALLFRSSKPDFKLDGPKHIALRVQL